MGAEYLFSYPAWTINVLAGDYLDCGEVEFSISAAKEPMRLNPQKDDAQLCREYKLAADHEQARSTADEIIACNPNFSLADYAKRQSYKHQAPLIRVIEALRDAGLTKCSI